MPHCLIDNELQNTDKKHIKKMKKYLHISENSVTHTHTQLADKGLNNGLNYKGGIFPIGGIPPFLSVSLQASKRTDNK